MTVSRLKHQVDKARQYIDKLDNQVEELQKQTLKKQPRNAAARFTLNNETDISDQLSQATSSRFDDLSSITTVDDSELISDVMRQHYVIASNIIC